VWQFRHRFGSVAATALAATLWAWAAGAQAAPPKLVVLGDSISAGQGIPLERGWVRLLERWLAARLPEAAVINASISGETTDGGLRRLPKLLRRHQPDLLVLELGGNDGLRGYPLQRIEDNLEAIILKTRETGARVLLLGMRIPPNYGRYAEDFHAIYHRLAARRQVTLVPFMLEGIAEDLMFMQEDGIHPTAEAQPHMLERVLEKLAPMLQINHPAESQ